VILTLIFSISNPF